MQSDGRRDEHNPRLCYEIGSDKEGSNTWSPQPFEGPGGKRGGTWSVTQLPSHGVLTVVFTQRQAVLWGGARHTTHAQTENRKKWGSKPSKTPLEPLFFRTTPKSSAAKDREEPPEWHEAIVLRGICDAGASTWRRQGLTTQAATGKNKAPRWVKTAQLTRNFVELSTSNNQPSGAEVGHWQLSLEAQHSRGINHLYTPIW